jgi:hypothetical protein
VTVPTVAVPAGPVPAVVTTASGQPIEVQSAQEESFYSGLRDRYLAENRFTVTSDLLDLDRLLFLELMVYRATNWLGSGKNYYGETLSPSQEADCRRSLKENSSIISVVKNDLGMTKNQRDKAQFESVGTYITQLKARGREHGVKRERELGKALTLMKELFAIVGAFDRADDIEKKKLGFEDSDEIMDWVRTVMKVEFDRIDTYFREHDQKFWIRTI